MIVFDKALGRMVDEANGQYLTSDMISRDEQEHDYTIRERDGNPIFGAMLQIVEIDESGEVESATVIFYRLRQTWIPKVQPRQHRAYFDGPHPEIEYLESFFKALHFESRRNRTAPRFEFEDQRATYVGSRAGEL